MANRSEAYDFSLFETRYDNTVPAPRREQPESSPKVIELPKKELEKNAKPKRHPVRAIMTTLGFSVFLTIAVALVYSQQQLAVLTEQINTATQTLAESQSLEVQLNMVAAQKMNGSQVEDFAVNQLGMNKIDSQQVTFVNVAQQDKGTVLQSVEGGSFLDRCLAQLREWFA